MLSTCISVMSGNVGTGQAIVQIRATALDIVSPTGISYEILSTEYVRGSEVIKGADNSTIQNAFAIDRFSGKVNESISYYVLLYYENEN